jgi:hypothetical protein
MTQVQVINNKIVQIGLPQSGFLKDGTSVSGYDLLPINILIEEGWVEEIITPIPLLTIQQNKISELNSICNKSILSGFDSNAKDGITTKHYDFKTDDQINMLGIQNKIFGAILTNTLANLIIEYKNSEQITCENDWTMQQFIKLFQDAETFKNNLVKKYHNLKVDVLASTTIDEINLISW